MYWLGIAKPDTLQPYGGEICMAIVSEKQSRIRYLQCSGCARTYAANAVNTFATCETCGKSPLVSVYDLPQGPPELTIDTTERSMWRYFDLLPVFHRENIVTLGEGWTPMLRLDRTANTLGVKGLLLKDESFNPTGSFKARGLSMAISKALELGIRDCIVPTAGNAGGAMAAYCARAGMRATVVMPKHTPAAFKKECRYLGATVVEVEGLISDCARVVGEMNADGRYFDLSTMKEPYRLEGKKTMGYEIAEQLGWRFPDVILYPTGGGTGLIGMWKAFNEMLQMGWVSGTLPRLIAVQTDNCKPVLETFLYGEAVTRAKPTLANGLAVPAPFAQKLIQRSIRETYGTVVTVSEEAIIDGVKNLASAEGLFVAPEGGALLPALQTLLNNGSVRRDEEILLLNTGSGYKYLENLPG